MAKRYYLLESGERPGVFFTRYLETSDSRQRTEPLTFEDVERRYRAGGLVGKNPHPFFKAELEDFDTGCADAARRTGPFTGEDLERRYRAGEIDGNTLCWPDTYYSRVWKPAGWKPLRTVFSHFTSLAQEESDGASTAKKRMPPEVRSSLAAFALSDEATFADVRRAYREHVKQYHPDMVAHLGPELGKLAEIKTKEFNEAYQILERFYAANG